MALRVAMVGCGRMAGFIDEEVKHYPAVKLPFSHAAAYDRCPDTEIVAACATKTSSTERFCRKWNVPRSYLDYREMIEKEKPDIVSVTTHAELHAPVTVFAAEHGVKAVYCEKPVALSLEEADHAVQVCKKRGVHLLIGHLRRYHATFQAAKEYIHSGKMGKPVAVNTIHTGELFHTGTHNLDLLNMMSGSQPHFVQACLDRENGDPMPHVIEHDVSGVGFIRYKNGVIAYVHARGSRPPVYDLEFICEDGMIKVYNNGVDWELRRFHIFKREHTPGAPEWKEVPPVSISKKEELPFSTDFKSMTLAAVQDLVHAIRTGEPVKSSGEEARDALQLGIAFIQSENVNGARIYLPVEDRSQIVKAR